MKCLKTVAAAIILALPPQGCEPFRDLGLEGPPRRAVNAPGRTETEDEDPDMVAMYAVAVEYPPGYDFLRDSLRGEGAKIILYRDGKPALSFPAGGVDLDSGGVVDGHLYSSRVSSGRTEILCDGLSVASYDGEESIAGILPDRAGAVTLGRNRYGGGFSCRRDGKVIFSSDKGILVGPEDGGGALRRYGDGFVFFYGLPVVAVGGAAFHYYMVDEDGETRLGLPDDVAGVCDAVREESDVCVVALKAGNIPGAVLLRGGSRFDLKGISQDNSFSGLRIFHRGTSVFVTGFLSSAGKTYRVVWDSAGKILFKLLIYYSNWIYPDDDYYCVERREDDILFSRKGQILFTTSGLFWSSRCAVFHDGKIHAAVSSSDGASSTVYLADGTPEMTLKGIVTGVYFSSRSP